MGVALVLAKVVHWGLPALAADGLVEYARDVAASSYADVVFAAGVGAVSASARWPRVQRLVVGALLASCIAAVAYAVASVQLFAYLRSPLTYPLWYLAGDMKSMRASLGSFLNATLVAALVAATILYSVALRATYRLRPWTPGRAVIGGVALLAWVGCGWRVDQGSWSDRVDHLIAASPHWEILASCVREILAERTTGLGPAFRVEDREDFDTPPRAVRALPASFGRAPKRPRNVILLVLESTGAEWMSLYGSRYQTTPRLEAEAAHALVFDNFYCHVGLSANSMAALTLSIFPYMTWREYTEEYPELPGASMAGLLQPRGYRTAFLHSGDLEFVGQDRFLAKRGFDVVWDLKQLTPEKPRSSWGADDHVLMDGVFKWLDADRGRPFYVMAWGIESHFPYEAHASHHEIDFFQGDVPPDDWDLGRYLNTLHDVDGQIGRLIDGLRERRLADDTLIAITGDHGEGFGAPHYSWGHGDRIYQENVHVPFLLWNPRLFPRGWRSRIVGGHVDVNPTLADLLGLPPDPSWQGRSMFDPDRPPRTYFYAANDGYLLGVRDGNWKYIYDATHGRDELYDLATDPQEQANLAGAHAARARRLRQRLAAWKERVERTLVMAQPEGEVAGSHADAP